MTMAPKATGRRRLEVTLGDIDSREAFAYLEKQNKQRQIFKRTDSKQKKQI